MNTTARKLRIKLETIVEDINNLIKEVPVKYRNPRQGGIVIIGPSYYWGELKPHQKSVQIKIKKEYEKVFEIMSLFFGEGPKDLNYKFDQSDKTLRHWIEFDSGWYISTNKEKNEKKFREHIDEYLELIDILDVHNDQSIILVPDTNALIKSCDPNFYRKKLELDTVTFLLIPTVLEELDDLKVLHRNEIVRDKAKRAITRIKGWRKQGSLIDGVTVDKTITIKSIANEPDLNKSLSWLDKNNSDDRIIAKVLEVQIEYPASRVILATADINLQNKAELALVEYLEI